MRCHHPKLVIMLLALVLSLAHGATLVFYPLESQDPLLGVAVSERLAEAFSDSFEVYGPAEAPALIPPFMVEGGFFNPTSFLTGLTDVTGAALVRSALGADAAVTGTIDNVDGQLLLEFQLATREQVTQLTVLAPGTEPALLVRKAADILAARLGLESAPPTGPLDLSGPFATTAQAIALVGAGFLDDAAALLAEADQPEPRALELMAAIKSVQEGTFTGDPALLATLSISRDELDEHLSLEYFSRFAAERTLPAALLWRAVLFGSVGDEAAAASAFAEASTYPYGAAAATAYLQGGDDISLEGAAGRDIAALLVAAVAAQGSADLEREKQVWQQLTHAAPWFTYPFERLSFIAFDEDDPLTAAQALAVAVELAPASDLYWTNLGWAYYLLGLLRQSEEASEKALLLAPDQYVASYNLGLVRTVTGRLETALEAYGNALRFSAGVDDAALDDLENARQAWPAEPAVNYALGFLYEAAERRVDAARQFERYVARVGSGAFRPSARERIRALRAPAPELQLAGPVTVRLGNIDVTGQTLHPGDPLYPVFEVYTPGEVLPRMITASISLLDAMAQEVQAVTEEVVVPGNAIGFVIDRLPFELGPDLAAGDYELRVQIAASEDRHATKVVAIRVAGEPEPLRQLLGYNIIMQDLERGAPLYGRNDLTRPGQLTRILLDELRKTADAADEVLPGVEEGRFAGQSGGEVFRNSTEADLHDFIDFLATPELRDAAFIFVEAYAQWALDGAPAP
jgi:tetratricopeptide (TPR) repeat protein